MFPSRSSSKIKGTSDGEARDSAFHLRGWVSAIAPVLTLQVIAPSKKELEQDTSQMSQEAVDSCGRYVNGARVHKHLNRRDSC